MDKSTSKQQVCVSDDSLLCCAKNWAYTPSASGSHVATVSNVDEICVSTLCANLTIHLLPNLVIILANFYKLTQPDN